MISPRAAERRLVWLTCIRWFPVGVMFTSTVLLPAERGLSTFEIGTLLAIQGFIVLGLELPSGALSDTIGRRPLLVAGGVLAVVASALFMLADEYWLFALSFVIQGVFRALESGSLESWFVDTVHTHEPQADIARPLARAGTALGVTIAFGALVGGLLVAWDPLAQVSALALPVFVATACYACYTALSFALVREPRKPGSEQPRRLKRLASTLASIPRATAGGLRLAAASRVLRGLILVEVFWALAMVGFETLTPLRLAELLPSERDAAALFGFASAAAWLCFAAGSFVAGLASKRIGTAWVAILGRLLNGAFVALMGLAAGVVGVLLAYGLSYLSQGAGGPVHAALLHRQADASSRATVLSLNSMVSGGAYSLGLLALTALAGAQSVAVAMIAAGGLSLLGALCYLPALTQERQAARALRRQ